VSQTSFLSFGFQCWSTPSYTHN